MEEYKKELIDTIDIECNHIGIGYSCININGLNNYNDYYSFMDKMSFDEIVSFINGKFKDNLQYFTSFTRALHFVKKINVLVRQLRHEYKIEILDKKITEIKDSVQNTADVVNLFTDIDKNKTNTDDEIKKVNNRLDKLESSINQLINLLQKS